MELFGGLQHASHAGTGIGTGQDDVVPTELNFQVHHVETSLTGLGSDRGLVSWLAHPELQRDLLKVSKTATGASSTCIEKNHCDFQ